MENLKVTTKLVPEGSTEKSNNILIVNHFFFDIESINFLAKCTLPKKRDFFEYTFDMILTQKCTFRITQSTTP